MTVFISARRLLSDQENPSARVLPDLAEKATSDLVTVSFSAKTQAVGLERAPNGEAYVEA